MGVVVVAAGQGSRVGGEVPKQFLPLAGVPILLRALRPFASHPEVARVVVVLAPVHAERPPEFIGPLASSGLTIVAGGRERSDSVAAGLRALPSDCAIVLVHDGARPFVERRVIDAVIAHARAGYGAVVRLVPDSSRNFKITTREDLALAEALAASAP